MSQRDSAFAGKTIGWDLGGVHVKAALVIDGRVHEAVQVPCRLWRGLGALDETRAALPAWAREEADHAVTMTGELTDCFRDRADGVAQLSAWASRHLGGRVRLYAGRSGFVEPAQAESRAADIASANWHATAALAGGHVSVALLVDIGSTTSDLIPIVNGRPAPLGYSDAERLETAELVYTGVVRTALATLAPCVPWNGRRTAMMAEAFATTADVYRLTGDLPEDADQQQSADLKGKTLRESETRLARMIGRDHGEGSAAQWRALAGSFAEAQLHRLHTAAETLLSRADLDAGTPLVTCGAGSFLAERLAARLGREALPLATMIADSLAGSAPTSWVSTCGPAVAVGLLAAREP